jgi:hypothetical protein
MSWFKVDDNFWSHPKTFGLSHAAVSLWVRSGSYSGNHLTDGVIERHVLPLLQGTGDHADELVEAGLWIEIDEGWAFHDWHKYQPSKAKVEAEREKTKERVAAFRERKKSPLSKEDNPTRPDPARPPLRVTNGVSNSVTPTVTPESENPEFAAFWEVYPRKEGKGAARNAYRKALQTVPAETIRKAAERYRDDPNRQAAYTAHASTWLNQERWDDAPLPQRQAATAGDKRMERNRRIIEWAAEQDAQDNQPALEAW